MFLPNQIVASAFTDHLRSGFLDVFPSAPSQEVEAIGRAAQVGLGRTMRTDALYHNLDHTILVTTCGLDILRGKIIRDGGVTSSDWMHFVAALVLFGVGFSRDLLPEDREGTCLVGTNGERVTLPEGATDAFLWPWYADRGVMFVRRYFANDPVLEAERLAACLAYARFPAPLETFPDTTGYPGLLRAAHLIGAVGDPSFLRKLKPIALEQREAGVMEHLGVRDASDLRAAFPQLFDSLISPAIHDGLDLLGYTPSGRLWLASLRAHLWRDRNAARVDAAKAAWASGHAPPPASAVPSGS